MGAVSSDATHATERDCRKHGKRDICPQINAYAVYGFENRTFVVCLRFVFVFIIISRVRMNRICVINSVIVLI